MAQIVKAHHTGLQVESLERSLRFYRDILGFEVLFQWNPKAEYIGRLVGYPEVDLHAAILSLPNTDVCLEILEYRNVERSAVDTKTANPGTAHIAFYVDDLDALFAELIDQGVGTVSEPVTPTIGPNRGGRAVYMYDPDGIRVEFIQSKSGFRDYAPVAGGCC
jgi:lactoylglutathione lyase